MDKEEITFYEYAGARDRIPLGEGPSHTTPVSDYWHIDGSSRLINNSDLLKEESALRIVPDERGGSFDGTGREQIIGIEEHYELASCQFGPSIS